MSSLITTTEAFNLELIKEGYLIIVLDSQRQFVGTGVVIQPRLWSLKCAIYTGDTKWQEFDLNSMNIWNIKIESVTNHEYYLIVIDPLVQIEKLNE